MTLSLKILGASSAIPLMDRHTSSQFLTIANRHFLIDCGEGTQVQLRRSGIGFGRVNHILISHLHGDHIYGLMPLLSTFHLLDRFKELHVYCPEPLEQGVYDLLKLSKTTLRYKLIFHHHNPKNRTLIYEDKAVTVHSFPLKHSIDCYGFLFTEKPKPRNIKKSALEQYSIPVAEIRKIKQGADWEDENGQTVKNEDITTAGAKPLSYAYCTDTAPIDTLTELLQIKPDLLYHEATFTEKHKKRAAKTKHSTALQASLVAKSVGCTHLIIGHYSVRYNDLYELLDEAKVNFENTWLADDGKEFTLNAQLHLTEENLYQKKGAK